MKKRFAGKACGQACVWLQQADDPRVGAALLLVLALGLGGPHPATAQTLTAGNIAHQEDLIAVRYKSLANLGDKEIYLGVPDLGLVNGGDRTDVDVTWTAGSHDFEFRYDAGAVGDPADDVLTGKVTVGATTYTVDYPAPADPDTLADKISNFTTGDFTLADLNLMQINVVLRDSEATLSLTEVKLDGTTLGSGTFEGVHSGWQTWTVTDYDFRGGFTLTGKINLTDPTTFSCNECSKIEVVVGHLNICGNGVIEPAGANGPAEDCEDGNAVSGDCCSSVCQFEPIGSPCEDDLACNDPDQCDGAGSCIGGPGDCSTPTPTATASETATDTPTPMDTATGTATVTDTPEATPTPIITDTPTLTPTLGPIVCQQTMMAGCRRPLKANKRTLFVRLDPTKPKKNRLTYEWRRGDADAGDYGDPDIDGGTEFTFCIYQGTAQALVIPQMGVEPGGTCDGRPCWKKKTNSAGFTSYKYKNRRGNKHGIIKMRLAEGQAGVPPDAKIIIKAKGESIPLAPLPAGAQGRMFDLPVLVQFQGRDSGGTRPVCWESEFGAGPGGAEDDPRILKNTATKFKAINDPPPAP